MIYSVWMGDLSKQSEFSENVLVLTDYCEIYPPSKGLELSEKT